MIKNADLAPLQRLLSGDDCVLESVDILDEGGSIVVSLIFTTRLAPKKAHGVLRIKAVSALRGSNAASMMACE
jgi:hypothetical protein